MKFKTNTMIIITCIILIGLATGIVMFMEDKDNYLKDAETYCSSGQVDKFNEASGNLKQSEVEELTKYLENKVDQIYDNYKQGKITYSDALDQVKKQEEYNKKSNYCKSIEDKIMSLEKSRKSFENAKKYKENKEYVDAYKSFQTVIKEDSNFDEANKQMQALKKDIVSSSKENAKKMAAKKEYIGALTYIDSALECIPNEKDLIAMKSDLQHDMQAKDKKDEVVKKKKAVQKEKNEKLKEGKVIKTKKIKAKFIGAKLTNRITPNSTQGGYMYFNPPTDDEIYLDIKFSLKNISKEQIESSKLVTDVTATYNTDYTYQDYSLFSSDSKNVNAIYDWDTIEPLSSTTFHVTLVLPKEVKKGKKSLQVEFCLNGQKQKLNYR